MSENIIKRKKEIIEAINNLGKKISWEESAIKIKELEEEYREFESLDNEVDSTLFFDFLKARKEYNKRLKDLNKEKLLKNKKMSI